MEKGAALNVFFREQNGRLEDTSHLSEDDYCTTEFGQNRKFTTPKKSDPKAAVLRSVQ
jgi:hypothetical protein